MTAEFKPGLLVPPEQADLKLTTAAELAPTFNQFGVCPDKCNATGKGLEVATVGEQATVTVHAVDVEGQEYESAFSIGSQLVYYRDATSVKCSVKKREGNQYEVCYQPTSRGRHQLHIKVESQHIRGSPFAVLAKLPIQKLGTLIRTIDGVKGPWGVAVDGRRQIVVAENRGHCISIFSISGEKIKTFGVKGSAPGQFTYPRGVAIDCDGNVLVSDNHQIQKFSPQGDFLTSVGTEGSEPLQFSYPHGIGINPSNKKLYVCDSENDRVQILNSDLTFSSSFGTEYPRDVTFDSTGCVYLAESKNHCVNVFTEEGQLLRKFGKRGMCGGEFRFPYGVAIDSDDVVYVADMNNHRVSMFTCHGHFLRSFGSYGTAPGQLKIPSGIAVDRDGFIYVSDPDNNRVLVF